MAPGFQDNFRQCDCPEKFGVEDVEMAREKLHIKAPDTKMQSLWLCFHLRRKLAVSRVAFGFAGPTCLYTFNLHD